jgi:sugar fermentation stimulation protein A
MVFLIQRGDCTRFAPCHAKDPVYARLVVEAAAAGVRVIALQCALAAEPGSGQGQVLFLGPAAVDLLHGCP